MQRDHPAAYRAGKRGALVLQERFQTDFPHLPAVIHQTGPVSRPVASFKRPDCFAGIRGAVHTIRQSVLPRAVPYAAHTAVRRLVFILKQAARTGVFCVTVFVADHAVHAAWSKHSGVDSIGHLHDVSFLSDLRFLSSLYHSSFITVQKQPCKPKIFYFFVVLLAPANVL